MRRIGLIDRQRRVVGGALFVVLSLTLLAITAGRAMLSSRASTRLSPVQGVRAVRTDDGLRLALSVPRGPYFRTELLPVTLVLTNNSGMPIRYLGSPTSRVCSYPALDVRLASGGQDVGPLSLPFALPSCPPMPVIPHTLRPG
ncbi:MAG TPA: hypothetical protein VKF37_05320, partial [Chloroflexota bacterium]|nr:hypothetical protein [Chloroflexota bacterium]